MDKEQMYLEGFKAKCAEVGVDPDALIKESQWAGAVGGASIGAIINALRNPGGKKRSIKDRLVAALKGALVGGGLGAVGQIGLHNFISGKRDALDEELASNKLMLSNPGLKPETREHLQSQIERLGNDRRWRPSKETAEAVKGVKRFWRENIATTRNPEKINEDAIRKLTNMRTNPLVNIHEGLSSFEDKLRQGGSKLKGGLKQLGSDVADKANPERVKERALLAAQKKLEEELEAIRNSPPTDMSQSGARAPMFAYR